MTLFQNLMFVNQTIPCKICATLTHNTGTVLCDNCWEVTRRLDTFLQTRNGRRWVRERIAVYQDSKGGTK